MSPDRNLFADGEHVRRHAADGDRDVRQRLELPGRQALPERPTRCGSLQRIEDGLDEDHLN